ncbi:MAG: FecR domain-containing protein [Flavobacteriaceae bacterium]
MENKENNKRNIRPISDLEKLELKKRILRSVDRYKGRRRRYGYVAGIAASIVFLIGAGLYIYEAPTETIEDYVRSAKVIDAKAIEEVVLVLGEGENVGIANGEPDITYSETGEKVNIGDSSSIQQKALKDQKTVYNTLLVPYGKRSKITLSDNSVIWLNSGSRLTYPVVFQEDRREVYLEGEAIFEVAHDAKQPFVVLSEGQEVEVLGTVFNVSSYGDENNVKTVLKSGSVQINCQDPRSGQYKEKLRITPGTLVVYNKQNKKIQSENVNVDHYFSWREGMLIFKNDNLQFIMKKLSRYYNMEINIQDTALANETFSGYLDLKEDIGMVLETIKGTTDMEYLRLNETKISINKKSQMNMK